MSFTKWVQLCPYQSNITTPLRFGFLAHFVVGTLNLCHPIPVSEVLCPSNIAAAALKTQYYLFTELKTMLSVIFMDVFLNNYFYWLKYIELFGMNTEPSRILTKSITKKLKYEWYKIVPGTCTYVIVLKNKSWMKIIRTKIYFKRT